MVAPYPDEALRAIYRVIAERRDVRRGFLPEPLPDKLLKSLLDAAHHAPSVGLMQPWRFIVIRDPAVREAVNNLFTEANAKACAQYANDRKDLYASMKLAGLREAPQHLCVVCDTASPQGHGLGRQTMPETALYSAVCAVQNLWLAARAEGIGVGWVSILDPAALRATLHVPEGMALIAYLCIGYVDNFGEDPELERLGWERRAPLERCVSYDRYEVSR